MFSLDQKHLIVENSVVLIESAQVVEFSPEEINVLCWDPIVFLVPDKDLPNASKPVDQKQ